MTEQRDGRRPSADRILEWFLVAAAQLWFIGVPLALAVGMAFAPDSWDGPWLQTSAILVSGGLQIGGLLLAVAVGKLVAGWEKLFLISLTLALASGWSLLTGLIHTALPYHADDLQVRLPWAALLLLLVGVPYLLVLGGWVAGRARGLGLRASWVDAGLTRSGSLGWGLAAAALVLWPWLLVGSLGDVRESAVIAFQSLVTGALTEWLWRGLALSVLRPVTGRRWRAGLLGGILYLGYQLGTVLWAGPEEALGRGIMALPMALLATELWARPGEGRQGVWGAAAFHTLVLAFPPLFADPRSEFEPAHLAAHSYMVIATAGVAILLFLGRKLLRQVRPTASRLRSAAVAGIPWAAAAGAYLIFGGPGFANDGYLIILREQADLSQAAAIPDREARLTLVHGLLVETAERSQPTIRAELDRLGLAYRPYYLVNMIRVDGTTRGMRSMARHPEVSQVMLNPNMRDYPIRWKTPYASEEEEASSLPWGVDSVDAEQVWLLGFAGQGIVVAGQDTGYEWDHPALKDSYRGWDGRKVDHDTNWHDAWDDELAAFDDDSHGTHTMGTAVGNQVGMAPDARWIGCRNMRFGLGNPGAYVECMEFFLAPYPVGGDPFRDGEPTLAPHVVNNSWGCPVEEGCVGPEPIHTAVEALRAAGIMMVVSAGNEGPDCSTVWIPASEDAVFSVGSSDEQRQIVRYSSRGPAGGWMTKPDVAAPGRDIRSSVPGGGYAKAEGTSMAGPHVAGLVALLWSANPGLIGDIDRTEQIINSTARPVPTLDQCPIGAGPCACGADRPGQVPNNVSGYGIVDALAAVEAALEAR